MKVAFLVQLPRNVSPGQRFRIEQFEPYLNAKGIETDTFSFIGAKTFKVLYTEGHIIQKMAGVFEGFFKRFLFLFKVGHYDYIFLQREASPVGPPVFEWILAKLLRKKLVLDFDDAIWIKDPSGHNKLANTIKCYWKIKYLCRWAYKVSVGNDYLADYARQYNSKVEIIPTCVDTGRRYNQVKRHENTDIVIGWTGSHSTIKYLDTLLPVLRELEQEYKFSFLVICDHPPSFQLNSLKFLKWNVDTEISDLLKINIGVMPLIEDAWSKGKCGFKLIQYLSLGIAAVASPVGVNEKIVEEGVTGFLCSSMEEWKQALITLLKNESLRKSMGEQGRQKIVADYSVQANEGRFAGLFD